MSESTDGNKDTRIPSASIAPSAWSLINRMGFFEGETLCSATPPQHHGQSANNIGAKKLKANAITMIRNEMRKRLPSSRTISAVTGKT